MDAISHELVAHRQGEFSYSSHRTFCMSMAQSLSEIVSEFRGSSVVFNYRQIEARVAGASAKAYGQIGHPDARYFGRKRAPSVPLKFHLFEEHNTHRRYRDRLASLTEAKPSAEILSFPRGFVVAPVGFTGRRMPLTTVQLDCRPRDVRVHFNGRIQSMKKFGSVFQGVNCKLVRPCGWRDEGELIRAGEDELETRLDMLRKIGSKGGETVARMENIARMFYLRVNLAPFERGSVGICHGTLLVLSRLFRIPTGPVKRSVSLDFESWSSWLDFSNRYADLFDFDSNRGGTNPAFQ